MMLLTKEGYELYLHQTNSHLKKMFKRKFTNGTNYRKVKDQCNYAGIYGSAAHEDCPEFLKQIKLQLSLPNKRGNISV